MCFACSCDDFITIMSRALARDNLNKLNTGTDKDESVSSIVNGWGMKLIFLSRGAVCQQHLPEPKLSMEALSNSKGRPSGQ